MPRYPRADGVPAGCRRRRHDHGRSVFPAEADGAICYHCGQPAKAKARLEGVRDAERTQQTILVAAEVEFASKSLAGARVVRAR